MKKTGLIVCATALALLASPAASQESVSSVYLPAGIAPSGGLVPGWNRIETAFCFGYAYGNDVIVKLANANESKYVQSRNLSAHTAMISACAVSRGVWVYSTDGYTWMGMLVSATPGG